MKKTKTIVSHDPQQFDNLITAFKNNVSKKEGFYFNILSENYYSSSFGIMRQSNIPGYQQLPNSKNLVNMEIISVFCCTFVYEEREIVQSTKLSDNEFKTEISKT